MFILNTEAGMLPFTLKKEYGGQQPVYFVLQEPAEHITVLCRELEPSEKETDFKNISFIIDVGKGNPGKPCLPLFEVDSIEKADGIVASYRKGIAELFTKQKTEEVS